MSSRFNLSSLRKWFPASSNHPAYLRRRRDFQYGGSPEELERRMLLSAIPADVAVIDAAMPRMHFANQDFTQSNGPTAVGIRQAHENGPTAVNGPVDVSEPRAVGIRQAHDNGPTAVNLDVQHRMSFDLHDFSALDQFYANKAEVAALAR